jgi:hypothetical protein
MANIIVKDLTEDLSSDAESLMRDLSDNELHIKGGLIPLLVAFALCCWATDAY